MTDKLKFTQVSRVIDPKTGVHYLDAVDENGIHWVAQQEIGVERWITYKEVWKRDPQQPQSLEKL
jgi:penicillin V acylase-like amidase (Ntn superfamily)